MGAARSTYGVAVYLAARYSRREELAEYAAVLGFAGFSVTSRWLQGQHQIDDDGRPIGDDKEQRFEDPDDDAPEIVRLRQRFVMEDLEDVRRSNWMIAFTEEPRKSTSRGGRHVEFGIAIERGIPIVVIGPRENLFHWGPWVTWFPDWLSFVAASIDS